MNRLHFTIFFYIIFLIFNTFARTCDFKTNQVKADKDCSDNLGKEYVCANSGQDNNTCIYACHFDTACQLGKCDNQTSPHWSNFLLVWLVWWVQRPVWI